jgi:hypothetical protein
MTIGGGLLKRSDPTRSCRQRWAAKRPDRLGRFSAGSAVKPRNEAGILVGVGIARRP